ncbi:glucan endo-1,3-beta-glucosidase 7-like protein [Carex littledalei]|uniref:glucan endo-1,3-beta-D-glucosidase n=1 Tax=Carex littledalei TaxID=544730 RepID=A0A833QL51_9POAL|nr:glucan endo-1,3-beta-glucosidase 7-like protein [Carex littledalei]
MLCTATFTYCLYTIKLTLLQTASQSILGVNYGQLADNLPPPSATARLLASTAFQKLRLYDSNPKIISAVETVPSISLLVGVVNGDIPVLASSPSAAASWLASNLPSLKSISSISVGNEVFSFGGPSISAQLVPAMENLLSALPPSSDIKISTVHAMDIMSQSNPPSAGAFKPDFSTYLDPLLAFLNRTGSPLMINPYPYFAYASDTRPETLAFCLFQPNPGRVDANSGLTYMNMFDAQVDAIRAALDAKGFTKVEIVVAETGWPHSGDATEPGATMENAREYNGNLVTHLRSLSGTPRVPGKSVETYLFALYDEDLKPGPTSERSFGLFSLNLTENYDAGLLKNAISFAPAPAPGPSTSIPKDTSASAPTQGMPTQSTTTVTSPSISPSTSCGVSVRGSEANGTIQPASGEIKQNLKQLDFPYEKTHLHSNLMAIIVRRHWI